MFLSARIPWLEKEVGLDRTLHWHRKLAPYGLFLIGFHVLFTLLGYSMRDEISIWSELFKLVDTVPDMLKSLIAFIAMLAIGISSYRRVRTHMNYQTWWILHLTSYLAVLMAFDHQVHLGRALAGNEMAGLAWRVLTLGSIASLLVFRWALPITRNLRHRMRVYAVVDENADTVSIWITGRNLARLKVSGGQFFSWRFVTPGHLLQAHPYSVSAISNENLLRITIRDLGDHSRDMRNLRPGTRVLAEGPYGIFSADHQRTGRATLIAGGVGITPIRSIIEELPSTTQIDVLYRVHSDDDVILRSELDKLAKRPNINLKYLVGSRAQHPINASALVRLVPKIRDGDIYVCGPQALTDAVIHAALVLDIPQDQVHHEAFSW
jgi:predicted ferric reductase